METITAIIKGGTMRVIIYFCLIVGIGITAYKLYEIKSQVEKMEEFNQLWTAKISVNNQLSEMGWK